MRIAFMGTPFFSVPILQALALHHDVVAVYTQPPKPVGRGYRFQKSPVHLKAEELDLPVLTPPNFKSEKDKQDFKALQLDCAVVAAYGLLLPAFILEAPIYGCINIHASLLPQWRGAAPIQHAILNGDAYSGVTIMQMDTGLDTGDMLLKVQIPLSDTTTTPDLLLELSKIGCQSIVKTLDNITFYQKNAQKQPLENISYAHKLSKKDSLIQWDDTAENIARKIRAFLPWPGTYFVHNQEEIKILKASIICQKDISDKTQLTPGDFITPCIVQCKKDALKLEILQRKGKKPLVIDEFLKGYSFHTEKN